MKTYTKISVFTAALLIGSVSIHANEQTIKDNAGSINNTQKNGSSVIRFANNGVIYITEDPNIGNAVLNIAAFPFASFDEGVITENIEFYVKSNYNAFIDKMEISVYRAEDTDLVEPVAKIPLPSSSFTRVSWNGELPDKHIYKAGDELIYVLRAYDKEGRFDETTPAKIQLLKPDDVNNNKKELREAASKEQGIYLSISDALFQYMTDKAFNHNALYKQNIIMHGSRVIIRGSNIPNGRLFINKEQYPVSLEKKFEAEYIVPAGTHYYDINFIGDESVSERLKIDISDHYFFAMAMADFTVGKESSKDNSADDNPFFNNEDNDVLKDGRLAFYLKGKAYSKYKITAQADTTQKDVKKLFNGFTQADAVDLFESLDPDMYYPTYGDDSTVMRDINTQGRFYFRTEWDKSQVLWGNYNTEFDAVQYGGYSRSLYGAKLDYRSTNTNRWGDPESVIKLFGSEAASAAGHTELIGTGGSLYYLKHTNILPGSDKISLQVTDKTTGNIVARVDLTRGVDYEIDNTQGRVILSRPLSQIVYQGLNSITTATLNGYEQLLIADYEFVPSGFESGFINAGVRTKQWIGDYIAFGGTYVKEEKAGDDYEIASGDVTLQTGKGTYIKAELTRTKSEAAPIYYSTNGGLSFIELGSNLNNPSGEAMAVDARINFKEIGLTDNEAALGAWWRNVDKGYSNTHSTSYSLNDITEYGLELSGQITKNLKLYTKADKAQSGDTSHVSEQLTTEYRFSDILSLSAEIKNLQTDSANSTLEGTLGALRVDYDINPSLELFATGQVTLYNDNGAYDNNDAVMLGSRYLYGDSSSASAQYTTGHRGDAFEFDVSHKLNKDHTVYGGYTWINNYVSDFDTAFGLKTNSGFTVGQKWNLTNRVSLYNESQYIKDSADRGTTNSLGMDFYIGEGWNTGFLFQKGELDSGRGDVDRDAFSINLGRTSATMNWASKLEYRQDQGAEERKQWLTTNRLSLKVDESLSLAGRFNYSDTKDYLSSQNGAEFTEANAGFAYRPYNSTKWAFFGRYTYLYDVSNIGQEILNSYDQKSQILSFESVYKLDEKWEFALKYALREGEARYKDGEWFDSKTSFYAAQTRYDILYKWHGLFEYRVLDVKEGGAKQGYLIGADRDITENFRVGVGYNFTNFSDDLTKLDYKYRGWFINFLGTY